MSYQDYIDGYKRKISVTASNENRADYNLGSDHVDESEPMFTYNEFCDNKREIDKIFHHKAVREKLNNIPYDLVPFQEIAEAYARVAEHGAEKYEPWNWTLGLSRVQLCCSLLRHTFSYIRGEDCDSLSGLSHGDHILWNAVALVHNIHHGLEDGRRSEPARNYKK